MASNRIAVDFGGSTFRRQSFSLDFGSRKVTSLAQPVLQKVQFPNAREFASFVGNNLRELPADQTIVPFSFAGPVSAGGRVLLKYTNQQGIEERNIPFSELIEGSFFNAACRRIQVVLLNDCHAAGWAEVSPEGVAADLPVGAYVVPIVHGTGIGGRNLEIIKPHQIKAVDGLYEFGHFKIYPDLIRQTGLHSLIPEDDLTCGCGIAGSIKERRPFCLESLARGPAVRELFRKFLSNVTVMSGEKISQLTYVNDVILTPNASLSPLWLLVDSFFESQLFQTVMEKRNISQPERTGDWQTIGNQANWTLQKISRELELEDVTDALKASDGRDEIANGLLMRVAMLLAARFEAAQASFEKQLNFVLVGGVGCNLGPYLLPHIHNFIRQMGEMRWRSVWETETGEFAKAPELKVVVGKFPADQTNLFGNAYYLMNLENK